MQVSSAEYLRRANVGRDTVRHQQRRSMEIAREMAETVPVKRGLSHRQANELLERFKRDASLIGDRYTGCWMKVGV
jgi:hypothetical protein